jgi:hypothetical protein
LPTSPTPAAATAATTSASWPSTDTHEPDIKNSRLHNTNTPGPCEPYALQVVSDRLALGPPGRVYASA